MLKIKIDSRKVKPDDTFVAIKGFNVDGHDYIEEAIKNGANTIVVSKKVNYRVKTIMVEDTQEYLKNYLVDNYHEKINKLKMIGITGTNGKTTSCFLIYQLLKNLKMDPAYIGTIGYYFNNHKQELPNTTPNILDLYDMLLQAIDNGCDSVVMEVSSHALDCKRIAGLRFDVVAFTNLTQDHLDYHKTMENYLNAKLKIINYLKKDGMLIVNNDDPYSKYFKNSKKETIGFNDDYKIVNIKDYEDKTEIVFSNQNIDYKTEICLKNKFNVYNYLIALACVHNLGFSIKDILDVSHDIQAPKGRCEQLKINNSLAVVDYAHTPDAVLKIITSFKETCLGKIITIIGCGGNRDRKKRPLMGKIATDNSHYVIFTNDNPRTEDPKIIMQDIISNINTNNYEIIYERKQAIEKGLSILKKNDILLILGKGHEDYQIIGSKKIHFDDMECLKNIINLKK